MSKTLFTSFSLLAFAIVVVLELLSSNSIAFAAEGPTQVDNDSPQLTTSEAIDEFTRRFIWSRHFYSQGTSRIETNERYYQGRHRRYLSTGELYSTIGHPAVEEEYRRRRNLGLGLMAAGTVVPTGIAAGGIYSYYQRNDPDGLAIALWGAIFTHWLIYIGGYYWSSRDPLESHERRELIEEYNLALLDELGLNPADIPAEGENLPRFPDNQRRRPGADDLYVDGHIGHDSLGLVMGFRF